MVNLVAVVTPAYMARIPTDVLLAGGKRLLRWLETAGLPRPSLLDLEAERKLRKPATQKKGRRR